jgi:hypothetical protein
MIMKFSASGLEAAIDGNEAAAALAHRLNKAVAICPITPSSTLADEGSVGQLEAQPTKASSS